ncbi:MAG TPA: nuclear transport factor 2 family protein [Pyrinomonadaceae bacterium]|nr:nuclear transport factor 2 family protein [Pyrinomonadaceae bacterium]
MKSFILILGWLLAATGVALLPARAQNAEEAAVRQAIEHYFRGHATGQGEHFRKVFHPDAKLFAVREGKFWQLTSEQYIANASGKPPVDEAQRKRSIESVDVSGNAAIAKIVLDYPQTKFTDYMSLLKIDGEWRIVNKTFYAEPKK